MRGNEPTKPNNSILKSDAIQTQTDIDFDGAEALAEPAIVNEIDPLSVGLSDPGDFKEAQHALTQRWGVPAAQDSSGDTDYELLLEVLTQRVSHLMLHRNQKLMASLYILDIEEDRYNLAMRGANHQQRATSLARAILERETEKIHSRRKYAARPQSELGS